MPIILEQSAHAFEKDLWDQDGRLLRCTNEPLGQAIKSEPTMRYFRIESCFYEVDRETGETKYLKPEEISWRE